MIALNFPGKKKKKKKKKLTTTLCWMGSQSVCPQ